MKKILGFSSIRSDYDLMSGLYKALMNDPEIDFHLIVSGAHLSENFGYTVENIEKDGINILAKIETLLNSNTKSSRVKSGGILLQSAIDTIKNFEPDLILFAGDREDTLIIAMMASYLEVKSIHFYAGDHAEDGYVDNIIRHSASKLATYHFVTLAEHKKRLVRIGESSKNIHVVGNLSLDNFAAHTACSKNILSEYFKFDLSQKYALSIFHPISTETDKPEVYFENMLLALKNNGLIGVIGYPNVDPGNYEIIRVVEKYSKDSNFIFYKNLLRDVFWSLYKNAQLIIGNSSSGICESASIPIPAINIGVRQKSRSSSGNVNFCNGDFNAIDLAIKQALDTEYLNYIADIENIYGDGCSVNKAYGLILKILSDEFNYKSTDPLKIELDYE